MIVINLWGAPGSGKSTTAAGLFFLMKINKHKVELVTEYAKDLVWDRHDALLGNQICIFAEQQRRLHRLRDHGVDYVITDSPLPLPSLYRPRAYFDHFDPLLLEAFHSYNNINYFLNRVSSFEKLGRVHNEQEAEKLSTDLKAFLATHRIAYTALEANPSTPDAIFRDLAIRQSPPVGMPLALDRVAAD